MQTGLSSLLWFAAIIAMIPLALWLLKRTPMGGAGSGPAGTPRTVAVLALSPQQRVVTVEVGQGEERRWLVLGVSAQGIQALHSLPAQGESVALPPPATPFAQLMSRLSSGTGGGDAR